jgi:hypothetical protein
MWQIQGMDLLHTPMRVRDDVQEYLGCNGRLD